MVFKDPDLATVPIVGIAERYSAGVVAAHSHARAQLMYAVSGSMTVITGAGSWVLPSSRALWIPGGVKHSLRLSRPIDLRTLYIAADYEPVTLGSKCAVISVTGLVYDLVIALVGVSWNYPANSPEARLAHVLADQLISLKQEPVHLPELHDPRARRFASIFYENPGERRSIETLAHSVGVSPRTLARIFKRETKMSAGLWCQQLRLVFALEKIANGTSVADAAFEVGYSNPSSFIAIFRNVFGITPGRFFAV